jgi:hypothetical protein
MNWPQRAFTIVLHGAGHDESACRAKRAGVQEDPMKRWIPSLLLSFCGAAGAADQVVSNCSNDAELRSKLAVMQSSGGGTLTFACGAGPAIIVLGGGTLPVIVSATTIDGGGTVSLSGGNAVRLLQVDAFGALTLRRLKLERGFSAGNGGAILAIGGLALDRCTLSDNVAGETGGAIYSIGMVADQSEFRSNRAGSGGALNLAFGSTLIRDSSFIENQSTAPAGHGGAVRAEAGAQVTIERSGLAANMAASDAGSALYVETGSSATVTGTNLLEGAVDAKSIIVAGALILSHSSLRGASGNSSAGVVFDVDSSGTLTNVTVTRYQTAVFGGDRAVVTLNHSTLTDNQRAITKYYAGTMTLNRTVLSGSTESNCFFCDPGRCISGGFNFSDDTTCAAHFTQLTDRNNVDPLLEPYGDLGTTFGHVPRAGSPVVDAAALSGCPATDQRGVPRPLGAGCDSGAVERQAGEPAPVFFEDGFE